MKNLRRDFKWWQMFAYNTFQFWDHFLSRELVNKICGRLRYKLRMSMLKTLKKTGHKGQIIPLERRKDLSLDEFLNEYVKKGIPVILEGAAKDWPCSQKWSLEYFKNLHGDDEIVMVDQIDIARGYEKTTLADVIDNIRSGGGKYYRFYPLLSRHPEHIMDFDYKWLFARKHKKNLAEAFQVFIGGKDSETPLHNASACNLFVQTYGEKKWILYHKYHTPVIDPRPVRNIYRSAPIRGKYYFNPFEENPDYETYPMYEYIDGYEVVLKPGDVLWNPPYTWHTVKNLSDSIGVGYRWLPQGYCFKQSPLYYFLDLCSTKPPFRKAVKLMKKDFNLVHMAETGKLKEVIDNKTLQQEPSNGASVGEP